MTNAARRDVRFGAGAIATAPEVVTGLGGRRVLLVCGRRSFEESGAARVLPALERVADVRRWSDFAPNADAADLVMGLGAVEEHRPDVVLGVGGGSAMDMAKLLCAFPGMTDPEKLHATIRAGGRVAERGPALVLAPTTSGSGSEATHFAVVYVGDDKFSVAGPALHPDTVLLDPELSLSGSPYQRATSGIDAVAQAMESLWAVAGTDASRRYAARALRMLLAAIEEYVAEPTAESARTMAVGSHLAGRAIDVSRTTAAHAMSYGITKGYGVSHGHAVALTLGAFLEAHATADPATLQPTVDPDRHVAAMREAVAAFGTDDPTEARRRLTALAERLGLGMGLASVGVRTPDQVADLVARVNVERLGNNPIHFGAAELTALVRTAV